MERKIAAAYETMSREDLIERIASLEEEREQLETDSTHTTHALIRYVAQSAPEKPFFDDEWDLIKNGAKALQSVKAYNVDIDKLGHDVLSAARAVTKKAEGCVALKNPEEGASLRSEKRSFAGPAN